MVGNDIDSVQFSVPSLDRLQKLSQEALIIGGIDAHTSSMGMLDIAYASCKEALSSSPSNVSPMDQNKVTCTQLTKVGRDLCF